MCDEINVTPPRPLGNLVLYLLFVEIKFAARTEKFRRSRLPRPEDFSKALYVFDIGQNDLAAGFRKMTNEQLNASIPEIVSQLATAIQVRSQAKLIIPMTTSDVNSCSYSNLI